MGATFGVAIALHLFVGGSEMGKWRHRKSPEEINESFRMQMSNLRRSCDAFDRGFFEEAARISSSIYILLHDGIKNTNSKSLLGLMGFKKGLQLPDTSLVSSSEPNVASMGPPLLMIQNRSGVPEWVAPVKLRFNPSHWVKFSPWWEGVVYKNKNGLELSRKNLIFYFRSQDGGAHVDDNIRDEAYFRFARYGDHFSQSKDGSFGAYISSPILDISKFHFLTVRQIAAEVETAIKKNEFLSRLL